MQQPADRSQTPPLDLTRLREVSGGDSAFEAEVLTEFESSAASLMKNLSSAQAAGDGEALARAAHAIKGSARTIGADPFAAVCQQLEQAGRGGAAHGAAETVALAARELERLKQEIATFRRKRAA